MRIKTLVISILLTLVIFPMLIYGTYLFHKKHRNDKQVGFNYSLIKVQNNQWGYEIYFGQKLLIKQQQIPCFEEDKRFETKEDAEKVAKLIVEKLEHRRVPAISKEELCQLRIAPCS